MNRLIRTRDGALELSDDGPSPSLLVRTPHERAAIDFTRDELRALRWAIDELLESAYSPVDRGRLTRIITLARCVPLEPLGLAWRQN